MLPPAINVTGGSPVGAQLVLAGIAAHLVTDPHRAKGPLRKAVTPHDSREVRDAYAGPKKVRYGLCS